MRGQAQQKPEGAFYAYPSCAGAIGKKAPSGALAVEAGRVGPHILVD